MMKPQQPDEYPRELILERGWDTGDEAPEEGWNHYVFFDTEFTTKLPIGRAVARDDNAIVECAEAVADYLCIRRLEVMKLIPLGIAEAEMDGLDHIGVQLQDETADGEVLTEDLKLGSLRLIDVHLKKYKLPGILDEWKEWPAMKDGYYFVGHSDTVEALLTRLQDDELVPGLHIYAHYPGAAFLQTCSAEEFQEMRQAYGH